MIILFGISASNVKCIFHSESTCGCVLTHGETVVIKFLWRNAIGSTRTKMGSDKDFLKLGMNEEDEKYQTFLLLFFSFGKSTSGEISRWVV